jgi:hypothetical protein
MSSRPEPVSTSQKRRVAPVAIRWIRHALSGSTASSGGMKAQKVRTCHSVRPASVTKSTVANRVHATMASRIGSRRSAGRWLSHRPA